MQIQDDRLSRREETADDRVSRVDIAIAVSLAAVTLAIALYFAPRGFHGGFVDMGHDGYQLRQVLDLTKGGVIFRDTFDQYGPLNGYLNAVGFIAFGRRLLAMKYFICGWYALIVMLLYLMARRWLGPPLAAFTAAVWIGLAPFYNHGIMISPHAYALFFQALATLIALRSKNLAPGRFVAIGLLAGLCWAVKQSMGAFYVLAIVSYLFYRLLLDRSRWRRVAMATISLSVAFFAVVGLSLALLWRQGALHDWYLQTIEFPREFYMVSSVPVDAAGQPGALSRLISPFVVLARAQWTQSIYWIVMRAVVLLTALVQVIRRRPAHDLVLIAAITLFLWLGAYPSANFMHQWWTASLTIPAFVVCVHRVVSYKVGSDRMASWATVAVVSAVVGTGVSERVNATRSRANTLTETISEPAVLRGIRTDFPTRRAFETLYRLMADYRTDHPGTKVVSIESADGWGTGMVESLPLISFFDDNRHAQPVYWSLPVLSTTVYPRYGETLWSQVRTDRPLIVEHRNGGYKPFRISGYSLLAAAQSDYGHWYVYVPREAVSGREEDSMYLASDGSTERGFDEEDAAGPKLAQRLSTSIEGAWRSRVLPSSHSDEPVQLASAFPLELLDPAVRHAAGPVNVYTWPADLRVARLDGPIEPLSTDLVWRAGRGDIVREFRAGAWLVDGRAQGQFSYLLQWRDEPIARGASLIVRGELFEGGLQLGFLEHDQVLALDQWAGFVAITRPGLFEAVLEIQKPGRYGLVVANCIQSNWWERARSHPLGVTLGLLGGGFLPNRFRVSQAGWIAPPRSLASANANGIFR